MNSYVRIKYFSLRRKVIHGIHWRLYFLSSIPFLIKTRGLSKLISAYKHHKKISRHKESFLFPEEDFMYFPSKMPKGK